MNPFDRQSFDRASRAGALARCLAAVTVAALFGAAAATAGPGNGYQSPRAAARVSLPTVVIVAPRAAVAQPAEAAAHAALRDGRGG